MSCPVLWLTIQFPSSQAWAKVHIHLPSKLPWVEWGSNHDQSMINPWSIEPCSNRSLWSLYQAKPYLCFCCKRCEKVCTTQDMEWILWLVMMMKLLCTCTFLFVVKTMRFTCLSIKLVGDWNMTANLVL